MSTPEEKQKGPLSESVVRNLRTVGAIGYYLGILPMVRVPALLPFVFATPFTILFILYVSGSGAALAYGLAGAITMTVAQQGLILGADLTSFKIEHKFQSIVVASPVSSFTYFISIALSEILFAAIPLAVLLAIVTRDGASAFAILEIIGVILLTWITTSSIGFFLSTYVLNTRTAFLTVTFISVVISVLPPVFYPLRILPSYLQPFAELAPTTHASILIQNLTNVPTGATQVVLSWVALPIFTAIFLVLALFKARWRES
ncbi:MAG: ABC transporter permease [Nitrososphaerales archaeon]